MIPVALLLLVLVLGIAFSLWLKVFALIPATLLAWTFAVGFAWIESFSLLQTIVAAFLCGMCLQFGYFLGGILISHRAASTKRQARLATRGRVDAGSAKVDRTLSIR